MAQKVAFFGEFHDEIIINLAFKVVGQKRFD
jgi:hypothetical protein